MSYQLVILGSGNLATQLSLALQDSGHNIMQVYSPTPEHATTLANKLGCQAVSTLSDVRTDADAYIISVKDDAIKGLAESLCPDRTKAVFMHTAGSVPMEIFDTQAVHYGVLYPMQTFSKTRKVDFKEIPCFVEASDAETLTMVKTLAESISDHVQEVDSSRRAKLHLAAVFAANLTNHCYRLAERVLQEENIDFRLFLPLIGEVAKKVTVMSPKDAQTGPMVRYDVSVMNKQLSLIHDERTRQIYRLMADSIHDDATQHHL